MNATDWSVRGGGFGWVEYSVIGSMLGLSLLIGLYYGLCKAQTTVMDYMLGGKKMAVLPVTISLVASHTSGVTLIGVPSEIYFYGTQYCSTVCSFIPLYFIVTKIYLPVFYNLQLNSLYEYLELRFSPGTRTLASFLFTMSLVIFLPVVIYIPALVFNQVTGIPIHVVAPVVSLICICYTSIGGLKAVVWTDTLQSVFTMGSAIFIVILGVMKIGSISEVLRINEAGGRLEFFNMDPNPLARTTFWSTSLGTLFLGIAQIAVHPGGVQRFISVSSFREAKAIMFWYLVSLILVKAVVVSIGLLLYATYHSCDPVLAKRVSKVDQILPLYVTEVAKDFPFLTGLFISGVLSAALSTMSAGLNTVAGTIYEDFVQLVLRGENQSEAKQSLTMKLIVLVLGVACTLLVFVVEKLGALFQMALSLIGVTNGALAGVFTLGIFFPRANVKGAMSGALSSLVVMAYLVGGSQYYIAQGKLRFGGKVTSVDGCPAYSISNTTIALVEKHTGPGTPTIADDSVFLLFQLSYMYYCLVGCFVTLAVGLVVSYSSRPQPPESLRPELFTPLVRRFLPGEVKLTRDDRRPTADIAL